jgi:exodeoxyribonuclease-5
MICHHLAPNGEKSLLYQSLEQKYGPDKAHDAWEQVRSQQFLNRHGDWMAKDLFGSGRKVMELDANGEPTIGEVEKRLGLKPQFKAANAEQSTSIQQMQDFIRNGNPAQWFALEGKAGTGKTTIVQEALAPFIEEGKNVVIAALAHKAKLVLSNKLQDRFGKGAVSSHTIASLLAMGMDMETGKFSPEFGNNTPPIMDADIIVIDEASMVNEEALDLILENKRPNAKLIFLGDIGQLPPIREKGSKFIGKASPAFDTQNKAKLLERVRQGEESPILPYADLFWDNSQSAVPTEAPAPADKRQSHVTSKGSLVFAKSQSLMPKIMPLYKKAVESGNPDLVKTVVYKNATRSLINKNIRNYVFGDESKKQFLKGDLLMFQDNYNLGPKTKISNSTEVQVNQAKSATTPDGWKIWELDFPIEGHPVRVQAIDNTDADRYKKFLDSLAAKAQGMQKGPTRTAAWKEFYNAKGRFAPIDYAYAITSHKSQGSTYDVVLVGEADINSVQAITAKEKSQSLYTAITRAKHAAFVMDGSTDHAYAIDLALQQATEQPAPKEEVQAPVPTPEREAKTFKGQMTFDYGTNKRADIDASSTLEAIRMGERTATTRYESDGHLDYWKQAQPGDTIEFTGKNGQTAKVVVTKALSKISGMTAEEWSKKEGWSEDYFNKKVKPKIDQAWQIEYKYVPNGQEATPAPVPKVESPEMPPPGAELKTVEHNFTIDKKTTQEDLKKQITEFYDKARKDPKQIYRVPLMFLSEKHKYGGKFTARDITNLLDRDDIPANVQFGDDIRRMIENSARRIVAGFKSDVPVEFINHNEEKVLQTASKLLVPKVNAKGEPDGFFTPGQQKEIVDSLVSFTERLYRRDPALKGNAIIKAVGLFKSKQQQLLDAGDVEKATVFTSIYEQRRRLTEEALHQLEGLGLYTDAKSVDRILDAVDQLKPMTEQEKMKFENANPDVDLESVDIYSGEFLESVGRISKDWSDNSFELDPKDTASARIKMFMGTLYEMDKGVFTVSEDGTKLTSELPANFDEIPAQQGLQLAKTLSRKPFFYKDQATSLKLKTWLETNYPRFVKDNFLGIGKTADYESIFRETLNMLGNRPQNSTFDEFMTVLAGSPNPTIQHMAAELAKADQSMKNEFMTVMMKQYQPFVMALFNTSRDLSGREYYVLNPIKSNRYNQRDTLIRHWQEQQKLSEITVLSPTGERVLDVNRIQKRWIPILKHAQGITDWGALDSRNFFIKKLGDVLRVSGIGVTDEMMEDLYDNPAKWTNSSSLEGLFAANKNGEPSGMFSIFIMKSAGMTKYSDLDQDPQESVKLSQLNNPLYTENTMMQSLAKLAAKYTPVLYSQNHRNSEGKSVWDWGMNTKLSHQFRSFIMGFPEFTKTVESTDIGRSSYLLKILKENPAQIADMELSYFDGLKPTWGKRGTTRQAMSDREQLLTSILLYQNRGNGFNRNSKVNYMSLTHSDKTMTPIFRNIPRVDTGRYGIMPATVLGRTDSALYSVFKAEYDRIINQSDKDSGSRQYEKGKGLFYFLPDFNYDAMKAMVDEGTLTREEFNSIWVGGQRQLTKIIDTEKELPVINKLLLRHTQNLVMNTLDTWKEHGLVKEEGHTFDQNYTHKILGLNGIKEQSKQNRQIDDKEATEYIDAQGKVLSAAEVTKIVAGTAAKDYAINHFLFNTTLSQLFYGDPAEAFKKSKEGNLDTDNVKSTMVEYAKRLAKDIAPRADLYWAEDKRVYNTITMADVNVKESYYNDIQELKKAYGEDKTNSTDAQELVTVQEKLDVLFAAGKLDSVPYGEMSAIITAAKGGFYKFTKPEHLAVIMQPEKPIYAGQRAPKDGVMLTDYIKSSAYALYPPLTQGREIDGLRTMMETNNIQRADYESARKLGAPAEPLQVFTAEGRFVQPGPEKLQGSIRQLDRSGFGIQQEVPYDPDKEAIKTLTQMNENLTEGISSLEGFEVPEHGKMDGKALKALKEDVRKRMLQHNLDTFYRKLNVDQNGNVDPEAVFDVLADEAKKDTRNSYTLNEIQSLMVRDDDGTPVIPLMFNTAAPRFESLLMGMVNKIAEVKMPGKSYVQASSTGYRVVESEKADLSQVIKIGDYDGGPLKGLRIEDGVVKPGQVILPFNFFGPDGTKLRAEDFVTDGKLDPTKVPAELLQLVGARIPNQKHSSMHPLEVVGFVPENMGDMVLIPAVLVKQMGGDFDVDKLYTYKRPYYFNKDTGKIQANQSMGRSEFGSTSTEDLQTDYFNIHWAVLMHPEMIKRVLAPLDKNDLVDESKKLAPAKKAYSNFYDPMSQLEDFQRGKDAKRLVGSTSWAVKFSARIQDKNLHYGAIDLGAEGKAEKVKAFIEIKDEHTGEIRKVGRLSGTGTSIYTEKDGDKPGPDSVRTKGDNHVMVQSESVDNAKNRTLDNLNLTPDTYKAVQALIELQTEDGWAANSKYWTRLLTQPIIKDYARMMKQGNDALSDSYNPMLHQSLYDQLIEKYKGENSVDGDTNIVFDPQLLLKAQTMTGDEFIVHQRAALQLFYKLHEIGQRIFELEAQFNQDVSGAGRDLFTAMDKDTKLQDIDRLPILGASEIYMDKEGNRTEVGYTFDATNGTALEILSQVLPYRSMQSIFSRIMSFTGKGQLTIDQQRNILKAFRSVAYTSGQQFWKDPQADRVRLFYGKESLGKRLIDVQKTWGKDNPFLARLTSRIGDSETAPDYVEYQAAGKAMNADRQSMTTGWLHLLLNEDEKQRKLGEDLLRYAFLTGGVQDANSFVEFVPAAYIAGTEFSGMLKDIEYQLRSSSDYENDAFLIQHMQHNPELAMQVTPEQFGEQPTGREYPESFPVPAQETEEFKKFQSLVMADATLVPFLSFRSKSEGRWILYMKNNVGETTYYTRIDTLGNQFSDEYNGLIDGGQRSIFQENRALAETIPSLDADTSLFDLKNDTLRDFNKGVSVFNQLGIQEGGADAINNSLQALSQNVEVPEYQRTVAGFLKGIGESREIKHSQSLMADMNAPSPIEFGISYGKTPVPGRTSFFGHITLHPEYRGGKEAAANVFLHEVMHTRLQWLVVALGHDDRVMNSATHEQFMQLLEFGNEFRKANPQIAAHMDALEHLRYEAFNALNQKLGDQRFSEIQDEVSRGLVNTNDHLLYYATSSLQEFVAHVITDKDVATFLNSVDTQESTLLSKVWSLLNDILTAFGKALGVKVKDGSVLKEAISRVMAVSDMNSARHMDLTSPLLQKGAMEVSTQKTAEEMWSLFNFTYNRPTKITNEGTHWSVAINNEYKSRKHAVAGQRGRILDKLFEQRDDISEALNREKDIKQRVQLRVKYREVREQINELQQTNDINKIYKIGKRQLEWVDGVLKSQQPTTVEVNLALNVAHIWENLLDILYGDLQSVNEVSKDFVELQAEAQKRRIELTNTKAIQVLTEAFKGDIQLSPLDFKSKLEDIDMLSANTLALTRAKPKLVQATAVLGWREANNRDEHIYRNTVRLQSLEKKMKEAGLTNEMMLDFDEESGSWGLVNRLSATWHTHVTDLRRSLQNTVEGLDKSEALTDQQRGEQKREAWNKYWSELKKTAVFVDSRAFFDVKTGTRKSGEAFDAALKKLSEEVGSEAYAKELVQRAEDKHKDYLAERESMSDWLDVTTTLSEEEKADKSADEQKDLLQKKKDDAMLKWLQYNSPVDLLNRLEGNKNINFNSDGDEWIVITPKKEESRFYEERYKKIEESPKMKEAYDEYRQVLTEMISYLPMEVQRKIPENFLPIVPKDTANWLAQVVGKIRNWDTEMVKALAATDAEEASRLRPDKIPIMYVQAGGQTKEVADRSTDVVRVLELFSMMALQHRYMGNVLDMINVAENVLREVNQRRIAGQEEGKPLRHVIDAMKYFKDALVFKKPKELQGKVNSPLYSMNPAKQIKIQREIKELVKEKEELNQKIEDKMVEGDFDTETEDKRIDAIDKQLTAYEKDARNIYGSKVVDTLISINQMKALGYNPFSAAANFTFAAVSVGIHARSRVDFDPTTTREAWGIMTHSMKKYWLFNEMGDETAQKVHALINRAGIMGDVVDTQYGESNISSKKHSKLRKAAAPFNWQRSGDYFTKGVLMVAMLKKKMVEVTDKSTGEKKEISLWDALDKEGKWNEEKYAPNAGWYSDDIHEQQEWNRYRDRMRKVSTMVFGNQDKNAPLMAKKNWILRLAGQFRLSWFPEGIATRFKGQYTDANLGRDVKGRWRTYQDLGVLNSGLVVARQLLASLPGVKSDPFRGVTLRDGKPLSDSAIDVENMRKNFSGLAWTVGITVSILMLRAMGGDQHKKDKDARRRQLLINMLIRNQQDLMLYSSPSVFNTISGNFLPATQVIVDYINAMKATGHYMFGDTEKEKHAFDTWVKKVTRAGLPHPTFTLYNKVETMMTRDLDKLQR